MGATAGDPGSPVRSRGARAAVLGAALFLAAGAAHAQPTGRVRVVSEAVGTAETVEIASPRCAGGGTAVGGGVVTDGPDFTRINEIAPVLDLSTGETPLREVAQATYIGFPLPEWDASVTVDGHASTVDAKAAAVCLDEAEVATTVSEFEIGQASVAGVNQQSVCGPGEAAVGGVGVESVGSVFLTSSAPLFGSDGPLDLGSGFFGAPDGWSVRARADALSPSPRLVRAGALCVEASAVSTRVDTLELAAGVDGVLSAMCPVDSVALGGGVETESIFDTNAASEVVSSAPLVSTASGVEPITELADGEHPGLPVGWRGHVRNRSGQSRTFAVAAVCVPEPAAGGGAAALAALLALGARRRP